MGTVNLRRIIPTVIVDKGKSFHRVKFKSGVYLGDPINICKIYSEKNCDELVVLDVSKKKQNTLFSSGMLPRLTSNVFVPVCYGGGVSTEEDVRQVFDSGVEKIVIKFGSKNWINLIKFCSKNYGAQSIVLNLNLSEQFWNNKFSNKYIRASDIEAVLNEIELLPIGELLVQMIDISGTRSGVNHNIASKVLSLTELPIIYGGGVSQAKDIFDLFSLGIDAVSVSTLFSIQSGTHAPLITYIDSNIRENLGY
jgi:cyclase